jgi:prepilin-type processing-associated H-X9-DG protein
MPKVFEAPGATGRQEPTEAGKAGLTHYQVFVGPGAFEPGPKRCSLAASIRDGTSNTIAIAEAAEPVPWTKPVDLPFGPELPLPRLGGVCSGGFNAVLFDGAAEFFKKEIYHDEKALRALIGWSDGEVVNLRPYLELKLPPRGSDSPVVAAYESARRIHSANSLKQLALAVQAYHRKHGHIPPWAFYGPDGRPLLSWRVALLPFLEQEPLFKKFRLDEPWDGPHNKALLPLMPRLFDATESLVDEPGMTYYQVFVGPGGAFEKEPGKRLRFADIRDGTANTLLAVEAGAAVPWTKPADLFFAPDQPLPAVGGLFANGFNACFFDGHVRFLSSKLAADEKSLRALIGIRDGIRVDPESVR